MSAGPQCLPTPTNQQGATERAPDILSGFRTRFGWFASDNVGVRWPAMSHSTMHSTSMWPGHPCLSAISKQALLPQPYLLGLSGKMRVYYIIYIYMVYRRTICPKSLLTTSKLNPTLNSHPGLLGPYPPSSRVLGPRITSGSYSHQRFESLAPGTFSSLNIRAIV